MHLAESGEMYLETILTLSKQKSGVRSIDICEEMGYSKPSVSRAVNLLKQGGYITIDRAGYIVLTDEGRFVAEKIYERHTFLTAFLEHIGVSAQTASLDACKIEHTISDESFSALKQYISHHVDTCKK